MKPGLYENVNHTNHQKNCLLKYIIVPFQHPIMYHRHQNMWQVPKIAEIIGEFGYNVDVINFDDETVHLNRSYELLLDIHPQNHTVYEKHLADNCQKVLYSTGAAPAWQNNRELARIQALNIRKQTALKPKALVPLYDKSIASFDALFLIGNKFTLNTFHDLNIKKCFLIKNSAYIFPNMEYTKKSPNTFLFFATYPQVLKGLDLLLEVFYKNRNLNLVVCSLFNNELDFCKVYEKELLHTPNILPVGPIDITSNVFKKIREICSYVTMPSCSEGMSGSILTAMSAGLIPIVSQECGLDAEEVNIFQTCNIDCIANTLQSFSAKNLDYIKTESLKAMEIIRTRYSPEQFCTSFRTAMNGLLGN